MPHCAAVRFNLQSKSNKGSNVLLTRERADAWYNVPNTRGSEAFQAFRRPQLLRESSRGGWVQTKTETKCFADSFHTENTEVCAKDKRHRTLSRANNPLLDANNLKLLILEHVLSHKLLPWRAADKNRSSWQHSSVWRQNVLVLSSSLMFRFGPS